MAAMGRRRSVIRIALLLVTVGLHPSQSSADGRGVLLLAHGGSVEWNDQITSLAAQVNRTMPTEVAFGMATRAAIQAGVDRLVSRGASEIVAVPLFISSWSSVITSTEFLLGQRSEAPAALAAFAKMSHGDHAQHGDGTTPIKSPVPVRMTRALNDHAAVADILTSRARSIGTDPSQESVVIVAHGPNSDGENRQWLADMGSLADQMASAERFASIDYLTLRDDAPAPVRDQATQELRSVVSRRLAEGRRVLVVPLLVSFGGIERGLRTRLEGLAYTMPAAALVPDDRLVGWVLEMAR
jgi:sirohydrochlorin cobaltochelatase